MRGGKHGDHLRNDDVNFVGDDGDEECKGDENDGDGGDEMKMMTFIMVGAIIVILEIL